tara:strand:+ start:657 stop:872 length:216 start_codon:yes stop_codon:yes gene_type:complete
MNAKNKSLDARICVTNTLAQEVEDRRERGHLEHETGKGIACNYKRFFITIENEVNEVVGVLEAYTAFAEIY